MAETVPLDDLPGGGAVPSTDLPEGYQPPSRAIVERSAGALGRKAVGYAAKMLAQRDEDVDYSGIPDAGAQAKYSLLSKPEDRTAFLKERYGAENVVKDTYGHDVIVQRGKKIAFLPQEAGKNLKAHYAALAGEVAPTAGIVAGGVVGAPLGPAGGAAFAAGGGGAGVALNQLAARSLGLPVSQSGEEAAQDIVTQGMLPGALGETGARALGFVGRTLAGPYRGAEGTQSRSLLGPWAGNNPLWQQAMADVDLVKSYGLTPYIGTAAPGARLAQRAQTMAARIFGDEIPKINEPVLRSNIEALTGRAAEGVPRGVSAETVTGEVRAGADTRIAGAESTAAKARQDAEAILMQATQRTKTLAANVEQDVRASREAFGAKASELYKPVDDFAKGPLVPTAPIKDTLKLILTEMPPTKTGGVSVLVPENLKTFAKGIDELPERVTFQQMQAIRHKFYSKSDITALNAGLSDRQATMLAKAADRSFDEAGQAFTKTRTMQVVGPDGKPITQTIRVPASEEAQGVTTALRRADQFYKAGSKRFDDLSLEALVKDATQTGFVQPEKVASYIARPGQIDKLSRIKRVVTPETFQQIGEERYRLLLEDSRNPLNGQLSGEKLQRNMAALAKTDEAGRSVFDTLYGTRAPEMRAKMKAVLDQEKTLDKLVQTDWVKAIRTEGPESLRAADWLTNPDNRLRLRQALTTFGEGSPEATGLKEYLARRIFSTMEKVPTKGSERYVSTELSGENLVKELNRYGRPYLEEVFGKQWADDAFRFGKAADLATRKNPTDAGGIVAAAIAIHPLAHVGLLAKIFGAGELLSSNVGIQYLSRGFLQGDTALFLRDMAMFGTRSAAAMGTVHGQRSAEEYGRGVKAKTESLAQ